MPVLQSLLLADHVYRDQATGKHVICGVFSTIYFTPNPILPPPGVSLAPPPQEPMPGGVPGGNGGGNGGLPGMQPGQPVPANRAQPIQNLVQAGSPYAYFSLTELLGRKTFELRYVDLHDNRSLFQAEVPIECDDPLKTIEISLPLPRLPLTALEERAYALEILCEGQLLGSHRVLARMNAAPPPATN